MNSNIEYYQKQFEAFKKMGMTAGNQLEYSVGRIEEVLSLVDRRPSNALELGCGMGIDAIAMNGRVSQVDAIEILEDLVTFALGLKEKYQANVNFININFLNYNPKTKYDLIYYLDGYGVGSHEDQQNLLLKVTEWVKDDGRCVIEIYAPEYWKNIDGRSMKLSESLSRVYGYDFEEDALLDTWFDSESDIDYTQVLKCYSLEQFREYAHKAGLVVEKILPGGRYDFDEAVYHVEATLETCMNYKVVLKKKDI